MNELRLVVEQEIFKLEDEMLQLENDIVDKKYVLEDKKEIHRKLTEEYVLLKRMIDDGE